MDTLEQAVALLNDAKLASDANEKVDLLKGLLELVIKKAPAALVPELLPDILELQVDPANAVRRLLPEVVEGAAAAVPTAAVVQQGLQCLERLLDDAVPANAKRAVLACTPLLRAALVLAARRGGDPEQAAALRQLWQAALAVKARALGLAAEHGNDGVRLAAVKCVEQAILLLTAETLPAVPGLTSGPSPLADNPVLARAALVREAEATLAGLVALLKKLVAGGVVAVPGPVGVSLVRAAGSVALQRPQFVGKLLPSMLSLANSGAYKVDAADSVQSGIASALAAALVALQRSQHASAQTWRKKMGEALRALETQVKEEAREASPAAEDQQVAKKARTERQQEDGGAPPPLASLPPAAVPPLAAPPLAPVPILRPQPPAPVQAGGHYVAVAAGPAAAIPLAAPPAAAPLATSAQDLAQAHSVVAAHVAARDARALAAFVSGLEPGVLADVVLACMALLPPRHQLLPDHVPVDPWLTSLTELLGGQQQPEAAPAAASLPPPSREQRAAEDGGSRLKKEEPKGLAAQRPPPRLPPVAPTFRLEPVPLTPQQTAALQREAVLRILRTEKTAARELQIALVARLASEPAAMAGPDNVADSVVQYVLGDFEGRGGFELVIHWLHVLFGACCGALEPSQLEKVEPEGGVEGSSVVSLGPGPAMSDIAGSQYDRILLDLLRGLQRVLPPSDRTINKILLEAPAIPMPSVRRFLEQLCASGPDWSTLALLAARDLLLQRPPCRPELLGLVLEATTAEDGDLRTKAVRLTANRLFAEPTVAARIEEHALQRLDGMAAAPAEELAGALAAAAGSAVGPGEEGAGGAGQPDDAAPSAGRGEEYYARMCALYCALCTKKHAMLRHLLEVYGQTSAAGKAAIRGNAGGLAKTLGPNNSALLAVVQDPPKGSIDLVLEMVGVLTEGVLPPAPLAAACLQLHASSKDPRALPPALPAMDRSAALRLMPALLELPAEALRGAVRRLVTALPPQRAAAFSPPELLAALHTLDHSQDPKLLRSMMTAVTVCMSTPELFTPETIAAAVSQLLTRVPLPQLFMRTVIQSVAAAPRLRPFVLGVLSQLVSKQIWNDVTQWKGWVMCAQQLAPDSFQAWLHLPSSVLLQALPSLQQGFKQQLAAYVASPACTVAVPPAVVQALSEQPAAP